MEAGRELRTEGKRQGDFLTQTLFWGTRLFCGVECFPEPVEIVTFSPALKYIIELFSVIKSSRVCREFGGNYPEVVTRGYKNKGREVNKALNVADQDNNKLSSFVGLERERKVIFKKAI